jgi:rhamnogalacturonan acetylesterase
MGPNDYTPLDDTNRARGTIQGVGAETKEIFNPVTKRPETVHTNGWYMRKYVTEAHAKGMTAIICSPVPHLPSQLVQSGAAEKNDCVGWSAQVAASQNAFFINLNQLVMGHYAGMTPNQLRTFYFTDPVHSSFTGGGVKRGLGYRGVTQIDILSLERLSVGSTSTAPPRSFVPRCANKQIKTLKMKRRELIKMTIVANSMIKPEAQSTC